MASNLGRVQLERAATIVAECSMLTVPEVAERHDVSRETVRNYLRREAADEAFADLCAKKRLTVAQELQRREADWLDEAVRCLRSSFKKLEQLVTDAKAEKGSIREVAGAIKIVGELQVVREALRGGQQPRSSGKGSTPPSDAGVAGDGEPAGVH